MPYGRAAYGTFRYGGATTSETPEPPTASVYFETQARTAIFETQPRQAIFTTQGGI